MGNPTAFTNAHTKKDNMIVRLYDFFIKFFYYNQYTLEDVRPKARSLSYNKIGGFLVLFFSLLIVRQSYLEASPVIDLQVIAQIESSGNPRAINKADNGGIGSYGLFQLSPYVVADFNKAHKTSYKAQNDALEPITARLIADWYLHTKIPAYLRHFKRPVTLENVLTAYNMGIGAVVKGRVAKGYIAKYRRLARG